MKLNPLAQTAVRNVTHPNYGPGVCEHAANLQEPNTLVRFADYKRWVGASELITEAEQDEDQEALCPAP